MIIIYDGTFDTFLTLIYRYYYEKLEISEIKKEFPNELVMEDFLEVFYEEEKALKVLESLKTKFPKKAFETILNIFMCDTKDFELNLLKYIILGFKTPKELNNINIEYVFYINNLQKELFSNLHKMLGFTRFEELEDGTLYAKIETKFNLVYFLGKHFFKRLNNQKYIIHDRKRALVFVKNDEFIGVQNISSFEEPNYSNDEKKFKKLWSQFFNSVTIESRENYKCQRNMVPLLYRTYMSEFEKRD